MAKNIVDYSKGRREYLDTLHTQGIFGLKPSIDNKDQALFLAALGCDKPVPLSSKKDPGGWFRTDSVTKYSHDVAMLSCLLLGTAQCDEDYDRFSQLEMYMDYVEQCAESGFRVVEAKLEEAGNDNNLLERLMLKELDLLYTALVENDL
ncbi:MAG: hypothetical protein E7438_04435 [Ruminococcaceae bacterium]|nr:hypothetical protein [Oscillospiraceae bacterium]